MTFMIFTDKPTIRSRLQIIQMDVKFITFITLSLDPWDFHQKGKKNNFVIFVYFV